MKEFEEYLNEAFLNEASLGRFWQHYKEHKPMAFVSADRNENTKQQNARNFSTLKRHVRLAGFGYNRIKGGYVEEGGKKVDAENSLLIIGNSAEDEKRVCDLAIGLGKMFDQSSIMFVDTNGDAQWISTREDSDVGPIGTIKKLGKFRTNNINDFYSKLGNKTFKFDMLVEEAPYRPDIRERHLREWFQQNLDKHGADTCQLWEEQSSTVSVDHIDQKIEMMEQTLLEASLGRFWQHYKEHKPMAFVSADRNERTKKENAAAYKDLKKWVQQSNFGYNRVKGGYVEEGGRTVDNENSVLIIGKGPEDEHRLYNFAVSLGKHFQQSSILFISSDGDAKWVATRDDCWFGRTGETQKLGKFKTSNINDFYSKLGNKTFKFDELKEEVPYYPDNRERQLQVWFLRDMDRYGSDFCERWANRPK